MGFGRFFVFALVNLFNAEFSPKRYPLEGTEIPGGWMGKDGGGGGGGRGGGGRGGETIPKYSTLHCRHQNDSFIKTVSDESSFNVSLDNTQRF